MKTKLIFFVLVLFPLLTTVTSSVFAEEVSKADKINKITTPQGTAEINSDQRGTSGVDAGATAKSVASANIINSQANINTNINAVTEVIAQNSITKTSKNDKNETNRKSPEVKASRSLKKTKGTENTEEIKSIENPKNIANTNNAKKLTEKTIKKHKEGAEKNLTGIKEIPFADNEQVRVILSNRDINRVLVAGDKIQTINGPTGLYTAKNDPFGSAYISILSDASFTIFLSTIKNHNFSLLVIPRTVPGKTVILEPTTPTLLANSPAETDSYQKSLIDLMSNMINLEPCEDYEYFSISDAVKRRWIKNIKKTNFYDVADVIPLAFYRGEKLSGVISRVRNKTRNPLALKPSYFYQPGVYAVALTEQTIPPLGACWLYQIVGQN